MNTQPPLLRIDNLVLHFRTKGGTVQAVDGVNFDLDFNKAVVVLGESGCGRLVDVRAPARPSICRSGPPSP